MKEAFHLCYYLRAHLLKRLRRVNNGVRVCLDRFQIPLPHALVCLERLLIETCLAVRTCSHACQAHLRGDIKQYVMWHEVAHDACAYVIKE